MSVEDNARIYYESARNEIISRLGLRDNVLIVYLGGISAVYGFALSKDSLLYVLLAAPYLALGASTILSQHHVVIGKLSDYLRMELGANMSPLDWERSKAMQSFHPEAMRLRHWSHIILILFPVLIALTVNYDLSAFNQLTFGSVEKLKCVLWWLGAISMNFSAFIIEKSHKYRGKNSAENYIWETLPLTLLTVIVFLIFLITQLRF